MKIHKLKKSDFTNLENMYDRLGCTQDQHAFPYHVYVSPKTYKMFEKEIAKSFKKQYNHLNSNRLKASIGMYLLNLGPAILKGLADNIVLVDLKAVNKEKERFVDEPADS